MVNLLSRYVWPAVGVLGLALVAYIVFLDLKVTAVTAQRDSYFQALSMQNALIEGQKAQADLAAKGRSGKAAVLLSDLATKRKAVEVAGAGPAEMNSFMEGL